jgi:hypothetical protein
MKKCTLLVLLLITSSTYAQKKWADYNLVSFSETKNNRTQYGLKNTKGDTVLRAKYVYIPEQLEEGYALIFTTKDSTLNNADIEKIFKTLSVDFAIYGLLDSTGKVILKPSVDMVLLPFHGNMVSVVLNDKYNLLTRQGKILSDEYVRSINTDNNYFVVTVNKKQGLVNKNGDYVLKPEYDKIVYNEGYENYGLVLVGKLGKEGCYSLQDKKMTIPIIYDKVDLFTNNFYPYIQVINGGKTGLYDIKNGKAALPCAYNGYLMPEYYEKPDKSEILTNFIVRNEKTMGMLDNVGKVLLENKYLEVFTTNTTENTITGTIKYSDQKIDSFSMAYFRYNYIDKTFKKSPFYYQLNLPDGYVNCLVQESNKKWGLKNTNTNNYVLAPEYNNEGIVWSGAERYFIATKNNQFAVINFNGKTVIPFGTFDKISSFSLGNLDEILNVQKNQKWGCIDLDNKQLMPIEYDREIEYADTMWVSKGGEWGCIDKDMKQIIEFKFDTAIYSNFAFNSKGIICNEGNKEIQLNNQGNKIEPRIANPNVPVKKTVGNSSSTTSATATPAQKSVSLYYAIYNNKIDDFRVLMNNNPEVKLVYDNKPPIYHVAMLAHSYSRENTFQEMITSLVKAGADPNQIGILGDTPLQAYFFSNYDTKVEQVRILLNAGCKVDKEALKRASKSNASKEIIELLKSYDK